MKSLLFLAITIYLAQATTTCDRKECIVDEVDLKEDQPITHDKTTDEVVDLYLYNVSGSIGSKTFSKFPKVSKLFIFGHVNNIADDTFKDLSLLNCLHLDGKFPVIKQNLLKNNENLERLQIDSEGCTIEDGSFGHLKKLTELNIRACNVKTVSKKLLSGLESLRILKIVNSSVSRIEENSFEDLEKLEDLDLSLNDITELKSKTLKNVPKLRILSLIYTNLGQLDWDSFPQQNNLEEISLPSGVLGNLSAEKVIEKFPSLKTMYLPGNDRESDTVRKLKENLGKRDVKVSFMIKNA